MRLRMLQKPPVIFTQYAPSWVISPTELARSIHTVSRSEAISLLWISYSRSILAEVDPCMEANEGAEATIKFALSYQGLSQMRVSLMNDNSYELSNGKASLYLCETDFGDVFLYFFPPKGYGGGICIGVIFFYVFLYFFPPKGYGNRRAACRIDLTDYGADAAAYFIATVFDSYEGIVDYYETNKRA